MGDAVERVNRALAKVGWPGCDSDFISERLRADDESILISGGGFNPAILREFARPIAALPTNTEVDSQVGVVRQCPRHGFYEAGWGEKCPACVVGIVRYHRELQRQPSPVPCTPIFVSTARSRQINLDLEAALLRTQGYKLREIAA